MTPEERFQFDLEGYLVVENVLDTDHLAELNSACDDPPGGWTDDSMYRTSNVSEWSPAFQRLIDHPKLLHYLVELLGPQVRLDHDYCILMRKGASAGGLHGGASPQTKAGDHWYRHHNGVIRNGLTVFTYNLTDSPAGKGGFGCIPGSHKSNFISNIPAEVRRYERDAHYVRQVPARAGDVIIFTEALVHGTVPWEADHERRAFLYKYSPGHSSWSRHYYDLEKYTDLTDQQRRFLEPPYIGTREDTV
ncbi:MAG: hypothetical protein HN712_13465 [Gemmatimonadetes bacterium]|jgi:ectoine hydroxylase-related dioxygenase (phytanoyl-CoA dioxygenase family)|nr:hypothetical protein [Gemmatimonadota bacterium]MBT6148038.1 hypothetical protein [Gemmatimonadota bacterium]MBT7861324.1 hypothetical protein [Gemmatimonadota bacterium]